MEVMDLHEYDDPEGEGILAGGPLLVVTGPTHGTGHDDGAARMPIRKTHRLVDR
jgi:hypothetical protein